MDGSVLDVAHEVFLMAGGLALVWIGVESWRRPDWAPLVGGPVWVVRCGSVGWVLVGCALVSLAGFRLAGREEDWPLGDAHTTGFWLVAFSVGVGVAFQLRKLYVRRGQGQGQGQGRRRRPRRGQAS
ncbi:hypothetical protein [Streptomyces sp. NPDC059452]|uniref:hypothetical protein n=1 Tax=Streptomyces sp. NPDC059452 TaxID=3346835 RepID=UPI00368B1B06